MDERGQSVRREDVTQVITEVLAEYNRADAASGPDAVADAIIGALEERGYEVISREPIQPDP